MSDENISFTVPARSQNLALALVVLGAGAAVYELYTHAAHTWPLLMLNSFYVISLAVSALFFAATQKATGARWSASLRRIPEAFTLALPVLALLILVLFLGRSTLFPWSQEHGMDGVASFAGSRQWLQMPWVIVRTVASLGLWIVFALLMRRASLQQDERPDLSVTVHRRLTRYSVIFIPVFALTLTMMAYDWVISLDPKWFSTMFSVYVFAGTFAQGIAAITLATVLLRQNGPMSGSVSEDQFHDLGKMLFAFCTFWAYIWLGQYLLIWYGNMPEEVTHFIPRTNGAWLYLFLANLIINWIVPFLVLLSEGRKRNPKILIAMSVLVLVGHWLDLYLLVMPGFRPTPSIGLLEIVITAGYIALLFLLFLRAFARAPMVPLNDPILSYEALAHEHHSSHRLSGAKQ
jgi:hypothetical protein